MKNVGGVLQVELPVAAIFQREARIRDAISHRGAIHRLSITSVIGPRWSASDPGFSPRLANTKPR
jgi:hypothetical protein